MRKLITALLVAISFFAQAQNEAPECYYGPVLTYPANNAVLKAEEVSKKPVVLKWNALIPPPPNNDVVYHVKVYEIYHEQRIQEALKVNNPVFETEVSATQVSWQTSPTLLKEYDSHKFAWTVEATGKNGKVYGKSDIFSFLVGQAGCTATLKITSDSCLGPSENGMYRHRMCATYTADPTNSCNILFNHATNNPTNNFGMFQSGQSNIFCSRTPGTSTANYSPALGSLPASLSPGASVSFCFDLLVPVSYAGVKFTAFGFCDDNSGNFNTANANDTIPLKQCICDACKELGVTLTQDSLSIKDPASGEVILSGILSGLDPNKIKKVTIELVYFNIKQTGDVECAKCAVNKEWGNFVPPATSYFTNFGTPVLNGGNFGREWTWISKVEKSCTGNDGGVGNGNGNGHNNKNGDCANCPGYSAASNKDEQVSQVAQPVVIVPPAIKSNSFSLPIALPPGSSLSCCGDKINVCIRYTWWDFCCHACDVIKCYQIERKPVTVNPSPKK